MKILNSLQRIIDTKYRIQRKLQTHKNNMQYDSGHLKTHNDLNGSLFYIKKVSELVWIRTNALQCTSMVAIPSIYVFLFCVYSYVRIQQGELCIKRSIFSSNRSLFTTAATSLGLVQSKVYLNFGKV